MLDVEIDEEAAIDDGDFSFCFSVDNRKYVLGVAHSCSTALVRFSRPPKRLAVVMILYNTLP
jgi:hypothetical protein